MIFLVRTLLYPQNVERRVTNVQLVPSSASSIAVKPSSGQNSIMPFLSR